jgi:ribosomal protein L16/L10AE
MRSFKHKNSSRSLQQGAIGLRVLKSGQLTGRQLEQARRELVNKKVNKKKKIQKI